MRTADVLAALFWLAIALGITASGWELGLGSLGEPGSGFMIFWVGLVMTALSAAAFVIGTRQPSHPGMAALWSGMRWQLVPYVVVLLGLYALLLPKLGFLMVTTLMLLVLFKSIEPQGWAVSIGGAVASTLIAWLVFGRWLGTQLPSGTLWAG